MPRKPRVLVDGGIYHIYNRGNNRRNLFEKGKDFEVFKREMKEHKYENEIEIYHYCLMTNHYHLLVRACKGEKLPKFMHKVQLGYARYYKGENKYSGHIFQERYRSPRVYEESYYLQCGRYIERNPVKARMVERGEAYEHSSARYYVLGQRDELVTENLYYKEMGRNEEERRKAYEEFLKMDEPYSDMIDQGLIRV